MAFLAAMSSSRSDVVTQCVCSCVHVSVFPFFRVCVPFLQHPYDSTGADYKLKGGLA